VLAALDVHGERPAEGLRSPHRHALAWDEGEPGEVAQELGVAVRHAAHGRLLARLEDVQGTEVLQRHVEPRVGDGIAVGVVGRVAELLVDSRFELLRDDMLEPIGLVVHRVDRDAEGLGEVLLEQPMVPNHLERDLRACVRELDAAVGRVVGEAERGELLHHRRD